MRSQERNQETREEEDKDAILNFLQREEVETIAIIETTEIGEMEEMEEEVATEETEEMEETEDMMSILSDATIVMSALKIIEEETIETLATIEIRETRETRETNAGATIRVTIEEMREATRIRVERKTARSRGVKNAEKMRILAVFVQKNAGLH